VAQIGEVEIRLRQDSGNARTVEEMGVALCVG
jgi:hypothetical protein